MNLSSRLDYYRRTAVAYLTPAESHLDFWHEPAEPNPRARRDELGEYYMTFRRKADYRGPRDARGVPLLNYRGRIGLQYNPIAIAQYGLGNYNLARAARGAGRRRRFLAAADWLLAHEERNPAGLAVWNHHFDWEYRTPLRAPWYSALAQGQGISLLTRAHRATGESRYLEAASAAFQAFLAPAGRGGVTAFDSSGHPWFEEYIASPPTHVLNGCIWACWGVYDFYLATASRAARDLFDAAVESLARNIAAYDTGFWSLYELSGARMKMLASPYYHSLHVVQLGILRELTGREIFGRVARRWEAYRSAMRNRVRATLQKSLFKLCYY